MNPVPVLHNVAPHDPAQLLFDMQDLVDGIRVLEGRPSGGNSALETADLADGQGPSDDLGWSLEDLCYKPLGSDCATESVLQYWQMDRANFRSGVNTPEHCLSKWSTECLSAFGAPIDPKIGERAEVGSCGDAEGGGGREKGVYKTNAGSQGWRPFSLLRSTLCSRSSRGLPDRPG